MVAHTIQIREEDLQSTEMRSKTRLLKQFSAGRKSDISTALVGPLGKGHKSREEASCCQTSLTTYRLFFLFLFPFREGGVTFELNSGSAISGCLSKSVIHCPKIPRRSAPHSHNLRELLASLGMT